MYRPLQISNRYPDYHRALLFLITEKKYAADLKGTQCLAVGICALLDMWEHEVFPGMMDVYMEICDTLNCKPTTVERNCRTAIHNMYKREHPGEKPPTTGRELYHYAILLGGGGNPSPILIII